MTLTALEYSMDRDEFADHVEACEAELVRTDADGREYYACVYVGREVMMGCYCPTTESADLYLI